MRAQTWKNSGIDLKPGTKITGKWYKNQYLIRGKLGKGAIGTVYLCESGGKLAALKISDKGTSMTVEVNVLKSLGQVQGTRLGPYLLDVDDWVSPNGTTYSFYVMEYLKGESLSLFVKNNGNVWIGVFLLQLLEDLEQLHQSGWVFGDLKLDNLIVLSSPTRIRWVDVGGTTQTGRAIKEYTEFYDRGYWGLGTRKAEPSYDLFSLVMVFLHLYYPQRFERTTQSEKLLFKKIDQVKQLQPYRNPLKKAIAGKYRTSSEMKNDVLQIVYQSQNKSRLKKKGNQKISNIPFYIEMGGISIVAIGFYILSLIF
ncbi:protein kinase family protein [Oceanobacillus caeni]|uniref:Serine/threonine protein kinase n=1 Tax=Oceanobacillus caeni TaxID=405946 RepID=A0ABR5MJJ4_9BACI|nr:MULTISPECIES: serine/threonine protein kinase [Bacillaceae]KKE77605.1 serine/threonine protein kinase [Bacilli bacterium VT-13-104]PZD87053.1 protein kinase family protein [Bacilli bacterium]KPH75758.1 serine/threonine protein kinase [Oceanobacillus caeni]MBU8791913.1 protein kinase family protein [Oceanobacillus caeni]MCR1834509.1 protein kinase family protein [Oceanobacillus caeni]